MKCRAPGRGAGRATSTPPGAGQTSLGLPAEKYLDLRFSFFRPHNFCAPGKKIYPDFGGFCIWAHRIYSAPTLTQEQLGFEADLRRTYVSILELGQQQPTLTTILKLAKSLNQSGRDLIGLVEDEISKDARRRR